LNREDIMKKANAGRGFWDWLLGGGTGSTGGKG
jgi:hypothetical protein